VHCKEQDIEVCALNLELIPSNIKIMTIYRALTGNFEIFLKKLDTILSTLYKTDLKLIICGDININYLVDSEKKKQLDAVLLSYNLFAIIDFPTRSQFQTSTIIDNTFIDTYKFTNYTVHPLHNGLSDHNAQLLKINEINLKQQNRPPGTIRNINKFSIEDFKIRLSYESWNNIFDNNESTDVDTLFNLFLNNYLRIFHTSFLKKRLTKETTNNTWITTGIKISCNHKKYLYLLTKNNDDSNLKNCYKQYCKILTKVIKEAKRSMYKNQIKISTNKIKTIWNIIKTETNRQNKPLTNKYQNSPDNFNKYFLSIADKIANDVRYKNRESCKTLKSPTHSLAKLFHKPFPNIHCHNTSTKEIEKIIKSLNLKKYMATMRFPQKY